METDLEQTASEETLDESGSADEQLAGDQSEVDYKALYEKAEQDRQNLESLIGRQGNELGELRELINKSKNAGTEEVDPYQYFDEDTLKAIDKIVEEKAQRLYESKTKEAEERNLRKDFEAVVSEYDITEENLADLAYYASSKGLPLKKAAEELAKKQLLEKRTKPMRTQSTTGAAPTGAPRVATASGGIVKDVGKMSYEQYNALTPEQREAILRKHG